MRKFLTFIDDKITTLVIAAEYGNPIAGFIKISIMLFLIFIVSVVLGIMCGIMIKY